MTMVFLEQLLVTSFYYLTKQIYPFFARVFFIITNLICKLYFSSYPWVPVYSFSIICSRVCDIELSTMHFPSPISDPGAKYSRFRVFTFGLVDQGSLVSIVSGYRLDDLAIEVRSPAEAKGFFL
jgi:hypothetical protein